MEDEKLSSKLPLGSAPYTGLGTAPGTGPGTELIVYNSQKISEPELSMLRASKTIKDYPRKIVKSVNSILDPVFQALLRRPASSKEASLAKSFSEESNYNKLNLPVGSGPNTGPGTAPGTGPGTDLMS